jgi:hypothetical protein
VEFSCSPPAPEIDSVIFKDAAPALIVSSATNYSGEGPTPSHLIKLNRYCPPLENILRMRCLLTLAHWHRAPVL